MTRESRPRFIVRPHLWLPADSPWECPAGHRLATNAAVPEHEALICQERMGSSAECGKRVWVRKYPDGRKYVAEISVAEFKHIREHIFTADQVLAFLSSAPPRQSVA